MEHTTNTFVSGKLKFCFYFYKNSKYFNEIVFKCNGQQCNANNNLKFRITTKVTFIDVSTPPIFIESKIAKPQATLPQNFFYPFVLNPNGANHLLLTKSYFSFQLVFILVLIKNIL